MRHSRIAWTVLVAAALLVAPAFAATSPLHKVTWRGSGVCGDNPSLIGEIVGNQVKFSGTASQDINGIWSGRGTFVDPRGSTRADLVVSDVTYYSEDQVYITGEYAAVTVKGERYGNRAFGLTLDRSTSECQMFIEQNIENVWLWWIPGSAFKGSIRIT
jgi:hypothetical protein